MAVIFVASPQGSAKCWAVYPIGSEWWFTNGGPYRIGPYTTQAAAEEAAAKTDWTDPIAEIDEIE